MPKTVARRSKAAEEAAETEEDYTRYLEKDPTDLQERFGQWILDKTGYEPDNEDDFLAGVQLGTALRMKFQASPENQEVLAQRREAAAKAKEEKAAAPPKKRGRPAKAKVEETEPEEVEEPEEQEAEEEEATPTPRKTRARRTTKTAAAKTATAKPAASRTRRTRTATKKASDEEVEAPF